jgi:hypothetical protein
MEGLGAEDYASLRAIWRSMEYNANLASVVCALKHSSAMRKPCLTIHFFLANRIIFQVK